jgi:polysaccharide export outer membrane protein
MWPAGLRWIEGAAPSWAVALAALSLSALAGCASLPSSGPTVNEIVQASDNPAAPYKIVELTRANVPDPAPGANGAAALGDLGRAPLAETSADQIQVGDVLQVTIFEIGTALFGAAPSASALSAGGEAASPPVANAQNLPPQPVAPDGDISVPYIGRVAAAGLSPQALEVEIETGLRGKSQAPQVMVTFRDDVGNSVYLMGDVRTPGRKPLSYAREHLLDMIAMAGGPTNSAQDSWVRVTRAGQSAEAPLGDIVSGDADDLVLRPHDRIEILFRPRSFTAFGASGKVSEVMFQAPDLSLAQALARIGGPLDAQADPRGVFIFRADQSPDKTPLIYELNMRDPQSYFVAQRFMMRDKDLIYVANAESNAWLKFLTLVNVVANPVITAKQVSR